MLPHKPRLSSHPNGATDEWKLAQRSKNDTQTVALREIIVSFPFYENSRVCVNKLLWLLVIVQLYWKILRVAFLVNKTQQ